MYAPQERRYARMKLPIHLWKGNPGRYVQVTHRLEELMYADLVTYMEEGKVVVTGPPMKILQHLRSLGAVFWCNHINNFLSSHVNLYCGCSQMDISVIIDGSNKIWSCIWMCSDKILRANWRWNIASSSLGFIISPSLFLALLRLCFCVVRIFVVNLVYSPARVCYSEAER